MQAWLQSSIIWFPILGLLFTQTTSVFTFDNSSQQTIVIRDNVKKILLWLLKISSVTLKFYWRVLTQSMQLDCDKRT